MRFAELLRPQRVLTAAVAVAAGALACKDGSATSRESNPGITEPRFTLGVGFTSTPVGRGNLGTFQIRSRGQGQEGENNSQDNTDPAGYSVQLGSRDNTDIVVANIVVVPGGSSGWHTHPGPAIVVVKTGTVTSYHEHDPACAPTRHPKGSSFIEEGRMVHIARNEGSEEATLVTTYFVPAGSPTRIDAPAPGNCPF